MSPDFIRKLLQAKPFEPFRIHLIDGQSYEVRHPEMVLVGYRSITLGIPRRNNDLIYQSVVHISLINIGRIEMTAETMQINSPEEAPQS
jgi:hypothetical protein